LMPLAGALPEALRSRIQARVGRERGLTQAQLAVYAGTQADEAMRLPLWTALMHPEARAELATGDLATAAQGSSLRDLFSPHLDLTDATGRLDRMMYVDVQHWLPDYL